MYYHMYEWNHAALSPLRATADASRLYFRHPMNPLTRTVFGRSMAAAAEMFERATRRYGKPEWDIDHTVVGGREVPVAPTVVWEKPFCKLIHFQKGTEVKFKKQPRLIIVAPMSGHYATLLRGTVKDMLPDHDVYVTDWVDARMVPMTDGTFDLDDFVDYLIEIFETLGPDCHVMAVCQPSVPVLAAVALMEKRDHPQKPASMILMGGPIDTRVNPTAVNALTEHRDIDWFRKNAVMSVPFPHPGFMRKVYPGFLQLNGFMSMNLDRHVEAHKDLFRHLVDGDGDSADKHRDFYDEYLSVMDLTAEFYLQTVDTVFIHHALPKGEMVHRGELVEPQAIKNVALMTIEGENDDISGLGQTKAAHELCSALPSSRHTHYMQPGVGHYGVFNGSRFRAEIKPRIAAFIAANAGAQPAARQARRPKTNGHTAPKGIGSPSMKPVKKRAAAPKRPAGSAGKTGKRAINGTADAQEQH